MWFSQSALCLLFLVLFLAGRLNAVSAFPSTDMWKREQMTFVLPHRVEEAVATDRHIGGKIGLQNENFLIIRTTFLIRNLCWLYVAYDVMHRILSLAFHISIIWLLRALLI